MKYNWISIVDWRYREKKGTSDLTCPPLPMRCQSRTGRVQKTLQPLPQQLHHGLHHPCAQPLSMDPSVGQRTDKVSLPVTMPAVVGPTWTAAQLLCFCPMFRLDVVIAGHFMRLPKPVEYNRVQMLPKPEYGITSTLSQKNKPFTSKKKVKKVYTCTYRKEKTHFCTVTFLFGFWVSIAAVISSRTSAAEA